MTINAIAEIAGKFSLIITYWKYRQNRQWKKCVYCSRKYIFKPSTWLKLSKCPHVHSPHKCWERETLLNFRKSHYKCSISVDFEHMIEFWNIWSNFETNDGVLKHMIECWNIWYQVLAVGNQWHDSSLDDMFCFWKIWWNFETYHPILNEMNDFEILPTEWAIKCLMPSHFFWSIKGSSRH